MKSSTRDRAEGAAREIKGKAKETLGRATGNARQEDEGTAERVSGKTQRKVGDVKKVFGK
ncbi:CsbD family protein [Horticoccus luteus]|uniref:CsbD family protein n=1 Tax=Horticoccus luteus TaxID=2862869 RepID=A0A8F9TUT0_9BACT|nr:CsbD family protein [Horticoccus luteus]QYM79455.1 CsbD family protein [Horticoccus luteus]